MTKIFLLASILFLSANINAQYYKLTVNTNIPDGRKLYLLRDFPVGEVKIDSVTVINHRFTFQKTNDLYPYQYFLTKTDNQQPPWLRFIWDGNLTIFLDSTIGIENSVVSNSLLSEEYDKQLKQFNSLNDSLVQLYISNSKINRETDSIAYLENIGQQQKIMEKEYKIEKLYIKAHPISYSSLESLRWLWSVLDSKEKEEYYNYINWSNINHPPYKQYFDSLLHNEQNVATGKRIDFILTTINQEKINLDFFKGKLLLIDFWGSWCGPCIRAIPELKTLYTKYHQPKGLNILSISVELGAEGIQRSKELIVKYGMNWQQVVQVKTKLLSILHNYNVVGYPTQVLLDKQGKIRLYVFGLTDDNIKKLESNIEQIKKE